MKTKLYFAVGASYLTGLVLGGFLVKRHYQDKADAEIKSVKDIYNQKPDPKAFAEQLAAIELERDEIVERELNKKKFEEYSSMTREYSIADYVEEPEEEPYEQDSPEPEDPTQSIISAEDFNTDESYDKLCMTYYPDIDLLFDDAGEMVDFSIEDQRALIFDPSMLECFGQLSDDPNVVYIRNEASETDFEVVKQPGLPSNFTL